MIQVYSLSEFQSKLNDEDKCYLLLANSENENGKCAINSVSKAEEKTNDVRVYFADLSQVRDIHPHYNITSAPSLIEFEGKTMKNVVKGCNQEQYYKNIFDEAIYIAKTKDSETPQKRVTVYSTPTCSWCNTLKNYLKQHGIRYTDINVATDERAAEEMVRRSGQRGVPQTDIEGQMIVGFDKKRINDLLGIKG